ncbi:Hypothetical protein BRZCDTV_137 [Brazilian cedratvirus IHUMI]|uniref:Uncharacterized protein n=1 Tax=Brazilian cedratvirus IHUMI TaxID=2126980 RepID=A0A2R8FDI6_9VIRU|nr:Hypothetical protein BRZCDTV_137 [Brazilian cedratvirus IHUMI]
MGIYYTTRFFPNGKSNPEEAIDIAHTNQIIDAKDRKRGYVLKEELLRYYGTKVTPDMIGPNSCLVEYVWTTLDPDDMEESERMCLPVK